MLSKVNKYDYVLAYQPASGVYMDPATILIEGDFLMIDPSVSIGPVIVSFESVEGKPIRQPVSMMPGDIFKGRFKNVTLSTTVGACGRILYGYGWDFIQGTSRSDRFQLNGAYSDTFVADTVYTESSTTNGLNSRPTTTHFGVPGGKVRGIGIRNGIVSLSAIIPLATTPVAPCLYSRINTGFTGTPWQIAEMTGFCHTVEAAQRVISAHFKSLPMAADMYNPATYQFEWSIVAPWTGVVTAWGWQAMYNMLVYK
jgi:hypothetical protein